MVKKIVFLLGVLLFPVSLFAQNATVDSCYQMSGFGTSQVNDLYQYTSLQSGQPAFTGLTFGYQLLYQGESGGNSYWAIMDNSLSNYYYSQAVPQFNYNPQTTVGSYSTIFSGTAPPGTVFLAACPVSTTTMATTSVELVGLFPSAIYLMLNIFLMLSVLFFIAFYYKSR